MSLHPVIGRQIKRWSGPLLPFNEGQFKKGRQIAQNRQAQRQAENEEHFKAQDELLERRDEAIKQASDQSHQSYALPGHQGVLGEVGGERLPEPDWVEEKPIAEHTEAEKAVRVSEIAGQLGVHMQPGRQISVWANKTHLPKREGGQGTLFAPAKYRP
jgi:hypothetical protein